MSSLQAIELEGIEEARKLFDPAKFKQASGRAVKKALDKSYTKLDAAIRAKWALKKKDLKSALSKKMFYGDHPVGHLTARSKPLPLRFFSGRENPRGVGARILKNSARHTTLDAFGSEKPGGTVFFRKSGRAYVRRRDVRADAKTRKTYIKPRLPITAMRVITVASMFEQVNAYNPVVKVAGDTWQKEFIRQLSL